MSPVPHRIDINITDLRLKKMTIGDLVSGIKHYRTKIGTECNKVVITKLENELFSRDIVSGWQDRDDT